MKSVGRIHAQIQLDIDENRAILINPTPLDVTFNGDEKTMALCGYSSRLTKLERGNTK